MNFCQRFYICLFAIGLFFGASTALADVAFQYHCAGGQLLAGDNNLATIRKVLALPRSTDIEEIALAKISKSLTDNVRLGSNSSSASLIKPLLSDAIKTESLGSFRGGSAHALSFIMALHLGALQKQSWQDAFSKIFGSNGVPFASQEFSGHQWHTGNSNSFWMISARDWLLVGCGDDFSILQTEYLTQIEEQGRPVPALKDNWMEADISSAGLGGWIRLLKPARISLTVAAKGDDLEINAKVIESEAIPWKSERWQVPTNLIRGQIISFTAGQNVAAFLKMNEALDHLSCNPLTNQFFLWAGDQMPFLNYMAWPVANASNALLTLSTELPGALNSELKRFNGTELVWNSQAEKLALANIRMFSPTLGAAQDNDGQFLLMSSFPISPKSKKAPEALLAQIHGRTNLVYYDWELTSRRLAELQILSSIIANRSGGTSGETIVSRDTAQEWINGVTGLVGNTVTEITRVAPNELSIDRTAPLGFTAVELVLLADWFCDANSGPIHAPSPAGGPAPFSRPPGTQ